MFGVVSDFENCTAFQSSIFLDITPCSPLKVKWRFGVTCRLNLQGRRVSQETNVKQVASWFVTCLILRPWRLIWHVPPKRRLTWNFKPQTRVPCIRFKASVELWGKCPILVRISWGLGGLIVFVMCNYDIQKLTPESSPILTQPRFTSCTKAPCCSVWVTRGISTQKVKERLTLPCTSVDR
jgi:hypothetical protein